MDNVQVNLKEGKLVLEIDPKVDFGQSKSGKSTIIASTRGSQKLMLPSGETVSISVNVYK